MSHNQGMLENDIADPYARCEEQCNHDLSRGVSAADLMGPDDGPKGIWHPLLNNIIAPDFDPETGEEYGPEGPPPTGVVLPESYTRRLGIPGT